MKGSMELEACERDRSFGSLNGAQFGEQNLCRLRPNQRVMDENFWLCCIFLVVFYF